MTTWVLPGTGSVARHKNHQWNTSHQQKEKPTSKEVSIGGSRKRRVPVSGMRQSCPCCPASYWKVWAKATKGKELQGVASMQLGLRTRHQGARKELESAAVSQRRPHEVPG